jgi:hypothetical protein
LKKLGIEVSYLNIARLCIYDGCVTNIILKVENESISSKFRDEIRVFLLTPLFFNTVLKFLARA